ncbi:hypothetical protein RRSWK_03991 [Rhodopirellula sp. SWK7]|nr:hypothetical protein RRSWK_03991 [Rhodopirellula sp. SWK7]
MNIANESTHEFFSENANNCVVISVLLTVAARICPHSNLSGDGVLVLQAGYEIGCFVYQ